MQEIWQSTVWKRIKEKESRAFEETVTELSEIYEEIDKRNIDLVGRPIEFVNTDADAVTFKFYNEKYSIVLDTSKVKTIAQIKTTFIHEIGHCATGCTHHLDSSLDLIGQHEDRANRWAVERFLPFKEMQHAMQAGLTESWQLAEYFDVSEKAIRWALSYYTENCGMSFNEAS